MKSCFKRYHYSAVVLLVGAAIFVAGAALHSIIIGVGGVVLMIVANLLQIWSMNKL